MTSSAPASSGISKGEFERFREFFYRKTGIFFGDHKRYFVDKRLLERMRATGHKTYRSYYSMLRLDRSGDEFQELVNLMTVNETYFFRSTGQLRAMVDYALPERIGRQGTNKPLRIWSIPCSTGEEPYSMALYLLHYFDRIEEVEVELAASDIDTGVLKRCKEGIYSERSVNQLPADIRREYFKPVGQGRWQLSEDIRGVVDFHQLNIMDNRQTRAFRNFDVIFCRNLLIYFDDVARQKAAAALFDALKPGGFLFLGQTESISRSSSLFRVRKFPDSVAYQKPFTLESL